MILIISGCQENVTSGSNNVVTEKNTVEVADNDGALNLAAQRVMCPGQVLDTSLEMKDHCNVTQIRHTFNIFDKNEKLIKVVETKVKGHVPVNLPEGEYLIKNTPSPVIPLQETRITLVAGKEQKLEINLLVSMPTNKPKIDLK